MWADHVKVVAFLIMAATSWCPDEAMPRLVARWWLSGLGGRRWRRWFLAAVQGEVEAQVGGGPTQGHSVEATVSKGSASHPLVKAVMEMRWMAARRGVDAGA